MLGHHADGDGVVLGLPRGGVPVAREVADALRLPLDVFVVRKVGAPGQPELALGAVASGGSLVRNEDIIRQLGVDPARLDAIITATRAEVDDRDRTYRGLRAPIDVDGRTAIVVDDGLATGATMRAAIAALRDLGVRDVVVAVPIAPADSLASLRADADEVVVVAAPERFVAVGSWYDDFRQVSDTQVTDLLK
ncbi:MAG TPA: phosphoribosyltransferase family protein [Acidimicrobiales bacterium]|nr:phosphoribosyltransferase family protein [Acidimicrobiales bacterium]